MAILIFFKVYLSFRAIPQAKQMGVEMTELQKNIQKDSSRCLPLNVNPFPLPHISRQVKQARAANKNGRCNGAVLLV